MMEIRQLTLLVKDYDEAIHFYVEKLDFDLLEDQPMEDGKRRVVVAPLGGKGCSLVLAKATSDKQMAQVGDQSGGRVFIYLHTDDIHLDYEKLQLKGVRILREPTQADFGTALVFEDLYGNKWDLVQPA